MTRKKQARLVPVEHIYQSILILRGQRVLLDQDLAALYSVQTRRLNEQVRRNGSRFPADFIFELTAEEFANLKSQIATSSWGGRRKRPLAFTEHGAIMAATVLNSARAVEMTIHVVRAFVQLRDLLASNRQLAQKLARLERDVATHDKAIVEICQAIRQVMHPPLPKKRPIGFTTNFDE
ncbi:MAG TPA: ORF6N domain-containing protein [Steroidobacter sp.]|uniref:ORF6N domain-containing protein n=1 Tax=Steroidobacter sp. TaxID=1978227 RepID=UPI002ED7C34A